VADRAVTDVDLRLREATPIQSLPVGLWQLATTSPALLRVGNPCTRTEFRTLMVELDRLGSRIGASVDAGQQ